MAPRANERLQKQSTMARPSACRMFSCELGLLWLEFLIGAAQYFVGYSSISFATTYDRFLASCVA